jgi:hypothetical protein
MSGHISSLNSIEKPASLARQFSMSELSEADDDDFGLQVNPRDPKFLGQVNNNLLNQTGKPLPKISPKLQKPSSNIAAKAALLKSHFENRVQGNIQPPAKIMNPPAKPKVILLDGGAVEMHEEPTSPLKPRKIDLIPGGTAKISIDLEYAQIHVDLEPGHNPVMVTDAEEIPKPTDAALSTPIIVIKPETPPPVIVPSSPTTIPDADEIPKPIDAALSTPIIKPETPAPVIVPSLPTTIPDAEEIPKLTDAALSTPIIIIHPETPVIVPSSPSIIPNDTALPTITISISTTKPADSTLPSPRFEVSLIDKAVRLEYKKHEGIALRAHLKTVHWFIAGCMNFFSYILPWWVQGAAEFKIDDQSFYVKRSLIQRKLEKAVVERHAFQGSAEQNMSDLKQAALNHFSQL